MGTTRYTVNPEDFQSLNARLLYISSSLYEGDWQCIPHTHHFAEVLYIVNGSGHFFLDGTDYPISAGDLIIVPPDMEHTEKSFPENPLEYIALGIEDISFQSETSDNLLICNYKNEPGIYTLLQLLLEEAEQKKEGAGLICQNLLEVLLIRIFRIQKLLPVPYAPIKMTKECAIIKRYLDAHYADSISLESLAALAHMNKYYLVHAFTKYTGLSPISYLNKRRLEISCGLLTNTNHSVSQIASLTGFSSQSYFAQAFKKEMGMPPARYRMGEVPGHPGGPV